MNLLVTQKMSMYNLELDRCPNNGMRNSLILAIMKKEKTLQTKIYRKFEQTHPRYQNYKGTSETNEL